MRYLYSTCAIIALLFYTLCWFVDAPTRSIHNLGIALPWLSLFLTIPIGYICKVKDDNYFSAWGYVYAAATIIYVVAVTFISGSIWQQLPHLAACVCFIAYFSLEAESKNKKELEHLKVEYEIQHFHLLSLLEEMKNIKRKVFQMVENQNIYDEETDEVIVLAREKVLSKFCKELLNEIEEYEKLDNDLYEK